MNVISKIFMALGAVVAMCGLSSCDNQNFREDIIPQDKVKVTLETFVQDTDGTLAPISLRSLLGANGKATITGIGEYFYNDHVDLKVEAKSPYTLHLLYEKNGKGGFTQANGVVDGLMKTLSFNVTQDMTFVAVFTNVNEEEKGYRNLKVDNKTDDFSVNLETTKENYTNSTNLEMFAIGEEVAAIKTASGEITGVSVINNAFKAWDIVTPAPVSDWLKASIDKSTGKVTLVAQPYNAKAEARTAKVRVGKNSTNPKLPSDWLEVTVSQTAFYVATDEVDSQDKFEYGDGSAAGIKEAINANFPPAGGVIDFATLDKTLKEKMYVKVPTYKNGQLLPESEWVKKEVTVEFGQPTQPWITKDGTKYSAPVNHGTVDRKDTIVVSFKIDGKVVATTKVQVSQAPKKYKVDVEIQ